MNKKTILITAGGTGGHIFPALSVANALRLEYDIVWVGTRNGIENEIVPKNKIPLFIIDISGLRRKGIIKMMFMPFILVRAFLQSLKIIFKTRPDVIVGFGGYATFPICCTGFFLKIPVLIHEQNSIPGLSNKILAKFSTKVMVAFNNVLSSKKTTLVGNPVRLDILSLENPSLRYSKRDAGINLLILGGSLGAKTLNDIIPEVCLRLTNINKIIHQVGRCDKSLVENHYKKLGIDAIVHNFIDDMADAYSNSDLIVCRSGASTVSEICAVGVAAIFIPYPYAVDDHQKFNALPLVGYGASYMVLEADCSVDKLVDLIGSLDRKKCLTMAKKANELAINNSVNRITTIIKDVISKC